MKNEALEYIFRPAELPDSSLIWSIIQQAVERRKKDGSRQWQDGYPNPETIQADISKNWGYVIETEDKIAAYAAIIFEPEPAYEAMEGNWLSDVPYVVIHRVAVSDAFAGKGFATAIFAEAEEVAKSRHVFSVKVDTNYDNHAMLKILKNSGYVYCGEVYFRGSARKAFQKILR